MKTGAPEHVAIWFMPQRNGHAPRAVTLPGEPTHEAIDEPQWTPDG